MGHVGHVPGGTSHFKASDGPHTPPAKRQKLNIQDDPPSRPLGTPPSAHTDTSTLTSKIEAGNLDPVAARKFVEAHFERHGDMKTDSKLQLRSKEHLEDILVTYFRHAGNHKMLFQRALGSNVIGLGKVGGWLQNSLKMKEADFDAVPKQVQPPSIPPLPLGDEVFLKDLITSNEELSKKLAHLN